MCDCGTYHWALATKGNLSTFERVRYIATAVMRRASAQFSGRNLTKIRNMEVSDILPPQSEICIAAQEISRSQCPAFLDHHNWRSYFWARLLNDGQKFDDEALFVALMLHDLGLTETHKSANVCFTLPAAEAAQQLAMRHGWSSQRADCVANAICLHLNITVADKHGREAQLTRIGSGADVAGFGLQRLHADQRRQVVEIYPRLDFKRQITACLAVAAKTAQKTRVNTMMHQLKFGEMIEKTRYFSE